MQLFIKRKLLKEALHETSLTIALQLYIKGLSTEDLIKTLEHDFHVGI